MKKLKSPRYFYSLHRPHTKAIKLIEIFITLSTSFTKYLVQMPTEASSSQRQGLNPPSLNEPLHEDVLWGIFSLCANMNLATEDVSPAIDTLRSLSQVSSSWRRVLIAAPSLWGRVLNLARLERSKSWLEEVVKRSDGSWLHVRAIIGEEHREGGYHDFVRLFVKKHWDRIWSLNIELGMGMTSMNDTGEWILLFASPSNLRSVTVRSSIFAFDLLPVRSPHLEAMELSDDARAGRHEHFENRVPSGTISMPNLRQIAIKTHWQHLADSLLAALCQISPADDCLLNFVAPFTLTLGEMPEIVQLMPRVLSKYLRHAAECSDLRKDSQTKVTITPTVVDFMISSPSTSHYSSASFRFSIDCASGGFPGVSQDLPAALPPTFISSFQSIEFDEIKSLSISLSSPGNIADMAFRQFAQMFPSLEHLTVDAESLKSVNLFSEPGPFV